MGIQLNIKSEEAHRLAVEVADLAGENMTEAVINALKARKRVLTRDERLARAKRLTAGLGDLWIEPWKSTPHGDLLYDEAGLPR